MYKKLALYGQNMTVKCSFTLLPIFYMILHMLTNLNQIYATYSMMTGLLSTIAVGILLLLIVSVIVITIVIWFPDEQNDDQSTDFDEVRNLRLQ